MPTHTLMTDTSRRDERPSAIAILLQSGGEADVPMNRRFMWASPEPGTAGPGAHLLALRCIDQQRRSEHLQRVRSPCNAVLLARHAEQGDTTRRQRQCHQEVRYATLVWQARLVNVHVVAADADAGLVPRLGRPRVRSPPNLNHITLPPPASLSSCCYLHPK